MGVPRKSPNRPEALTHPDTAANADKPRRVRLSRAKGWRMPPNTVKVTRPGLYGNPFVHPDPAEAVEAFRRRCRGGTQSFSMGPGGLQFASSLHRHALHWSWPEWLRKEGLAALRGKNLACWCKLDAPCHADVLLELANANQAERSEAATPSEARK